MKHGEPDEYGINVCVDCGCDLVLGVHVEEEAGFSGFPNRD
ncbi:hypothetical protein LCGC14_2104640 [marine sediment metagenome]|uniref:Uncharacterized protein n=1 Tax=marine sediment metagenome TaxID=412755 RepID=A0A0F9GM24_9ZZZZ